MYGKLSSPLTLSSDYSSSLAIAYSFFEQNIAPPENRPLLFGKRVFIEAREQIDNRPSGFWHIVSLERNHRFTKILPCNNDAAITTCMENCNHPTHAISLKSGTETRNICLYRASRIPWIIDIITLANSGDSDIQMWLKPGGQYASNKLYLRYNKSGADYVLIFSAEKKYYRLISAFPVFYLSEKATFDKDAAQYMWKYSQAS